jgi:hypothetical protein
LNNDTITESLESLLPKPKAKFLSQPSNLLLLMAALLLILPIFFWGQGIAIIAPRIMIWLTEKYYCWGLASFLAICWLVYFFWNKLLFSRYLTNIHIGVTIVLICWLILDTKWLVPPQDREPKTMILRVLLDSNVKEIRITSWAAIIFIAAQLCFVVNFILGLIRKRKSRS